MGIAGGASFNALVALAVRSNGLPLATRDGHAATTYLALVVDLGLIVDALENSAGSAVTPEVSLSDRSP